MVTVCPDTLCPKAVLKLSYPQIQSNYYSLDGFVFCSCQWRKDSHRLIHTKTCPAHKASEHISQYNTLLIHKQIKDKYFLATGACDDNHQLGAVAALESNLVYFGKKRP